MPFNKDHNILTKKLYLLKDALNWIADRISK